jgi:hypothetical protein
MSKRVQLTTQSRYIRVSSKQFSHLHHVCKTGQGPCLKASAFHQHSCDHGNGSSNPGNLTSKLTGTLAMAAWNCDAIISMVFWISIVM